eukprot:CAMPEP_0172601678 /NCGR_PEP_ID=MMETSP1068-20121228/21854_1 /TAXON_ID=35684 /ORGANISM="Pseudopedinella elastica, Strain CCMP716" /LENGTH=47 /DNA_ID=CAMNT_0013402757 /DNA_START=277 /DNA_END=420 /DNA_ORIENTATION=+
MDPCMAGSSSKSRKKFAPVRPSSQSSLSTSSGKLPFPLLASGSEFPV